MRSLRWLGKSVNPAVLTGFWSRVDFTEINARCRGIVKLCRSCWILGLDSSQTLVSLLLTKVSYGFKPHILIVGIWFQDYIRSRLPSFKHAHHFRHSRPKWWGCICAQDSHFHHHFCFFFTDFRPQRLINKLQKLSTLLQMTGLKWKYLSFLQDNSIDDLKDFLTSIMADVHFNLSNEKHQNGTWTTDTINWTGIERKGIPNLKDKSNCYLAYNRCFFH